MRFTSVLALITFIELLQGVGYTCSLSNSELIEVIKKMPLYVSSYDVVILKINNGEKYSLVFSRKDIGVQLIIEVNKNERKQN